MALPDELAIRAALDRHERREVPALPGRTNHLLAGVLVPLRWRADDVEVVLTLRTPHLSTHAGEVSFPGGRHEPQDPDLEATALREAEEEIGLRNAVVMGRLSSIPLYTSDYRLEPYVARIPENAELALNPGEVAALVTVDVRDTLDRPTLHGIPWEHEGTRYISPIFETKTKLVFGGTAYALWELLQVVAPLFGLEPPALVPGKYEWSDVIDTSGS